MESFTKMLNAQLILLVYMAVGMYCMKIHLIDQETKKKLVDLILKITLPCMIFNSFNKPLTPQILIQTAMILAVAFCISILSYVLGKVIYNRYPQDKKSILQYCTLVNNSGFLGMPMVSSVYGADGLFAASIFIIPNRIFMWTAGLAVFTTADFKTKCKNILLNPCIPGPGPKNQRLSCSRFPGHCHRQHRRCHLPAFHDGNRHHDDRGPMETAAGAQPFLSGLHPPHRPAHGGPSHP